MTERIWAPWRMEYVLGPKGGPCIFCAFPEGGVDTFRKNLVLVVQPLAYVCLNKYPFAAGHLLVLPRRHAARLSELTEEEHDAQARLLRDTVACIEKDLAPAGINVGYNLGLAAGAGMADHLHAHVVPRWIGDSNFMPVVGDVRVMPEYLDDTWKRLRPAFEGVPGLKAPLG